MPTKITSVEQLKNLAKNGCDCFILLRGNLRSSKHVWYCEEGQFEIINYIDGSEQYLTEKKLMDKTFTNIGEAMMKGAFFKDD